MKITMYELLGMIKDGKAPKKIKYDNRVYTFDDTKDDYYENETCSINWDYVVIYCLNEEVEILEEPKGIPEKLDVDEEEKGKFIIWSTEFEQCTTLEMKIIKRQDYVIKKINEIIDYLESKGE